MSETCLKLEALHKALAKADKIVEEAVTRTPATITSYPRLVSLSELTKGSLNITRDLLKILCENTNS
jgi:uncharacterized protein YbaP (TraB family)